MARAKGRRKKPNSREHVRKQSREGGGEPIRWVFF